MAGLCRNFMLPSSRAGKSQLPSDQQEDVNPKNWFESIILGQLEDILAAIILFGSSSYPAMRTRKII